jgi:hypothetical protein
VATRQTLGWSRTGIICLSAALLLAGCSSTTHPPLRVGGAEGQLCLPGTFPGDLTYGFEEVANTGPEPVVITSVDLVDPDALQLVEARLVPIRDRTLVGVFPTWPSDSMRGADAGVAAESAVIPPGATTNLVLHLRAIAQRGGMARIRLTARVDHETTTAEGSTSLRFAPTC